MNTGALRHLVTLETPNGSNGYAPLPQPYADLVRADGASHYWRLDDAGSVALDVIGGATGQITGGVTRGVPGALVDGNAAMTFDGTTGKIATTALQLVVPFTFETWIKTSLAGAPPSPIFTTPDSANIVVIGMYPGVYQCYVNGAYCRPDPALGPTDGLWHHLVWVLSGGTTIALFVDGAAHPVSPQLPAGVTATALGPCEIGYTAIWGPALSWNGSLDDVAIYPRALTAAEIAAHYAAGTTRPDWACGLTSLGPDLGVLLTGRYHPGINTATRVHFANGRIFQVDSVVNREERDVELVLACREVFT